MKEIYDWVPCFRELAKKIDEGGEKYLIERAKKVNWDKEHPSLLEFGDKNIDPFSFFYFLAQQNGGTITKRRTVYRSVEKEFELQDTIPDNNIFPTPGFLVSVLFFDNKLETADPGLLWKLFRRVVKDEPETSDEDFDDYFKRTLKIKTVGVSKLTQTLFLINPHCFFPIDKGTLHFAKHLGVQKFREVAKRIRNEGWKAYEDTVQKIQEVFPGCSIDEINPLLYLLSRWSKKSGGVGKNIFQVSSRVYGDQSEDYWSGREGSFEENYWVYTGGPGGGIGFPEDGSAVPKPEKDAYPLSEPEPGDIILVRHGTQGGKAIGAVFENDYNKENGLNSESRIHVLWMNKTEVGLEGTTERGGFNRTDRSKATYKAFAETSAFRPTLDFVEKISPGPKPIPPNMQNQTLNRILYGPPGTGKTWITKDHALSIIEDKSLDDIKKEDRKEVNARFKRLREEGRIKMVTFHQGFSYEDFIEGIKPVLSEDSESGVDYALRDGVLKQISKSAGEEGNSQKKYVLIIDEINRGNIAKIFGELITLVEPSKRRGKEDPAEVTLPYSKEPFCMPKNLYLIGTMNTADRSIALLDTALRRRFEFIEMMPNPEHDDINTVDKVDCQELLKKMNQRITVLLGRDYQIGHTYFLNVTDMQGLKKTFQNKIIPLLQEYFYDNWEKIDLVLNKNGFIKVDIKVEDLQGLFSDTSLIENDKKVYELLPFDDSKWSGPEAYKKIYENKSEPEASEQ